MARLGYVVHHFTQADRVGPAMSEIKDFKVGARKADAERQADPMVGPLMKRLAAAMAAICPFA